MAARRKNRWKRILPTVTLTAIPFTVFCPTAGAFFPPVVSPPVVVVVPPVVVPPVVVPPVSPPPIVVPPVTPPGVPEPATIVTSLIGLAAAAGYRRAVRRKEMDGGETEARGQE